MSGLVREIAEHVGKSLPPVISLVTYYENEQAQNQQTGRKRLIDARSPGLLRLRSMSFADAYVRLLVVDDEISSGESVKASLTAVQDTIRQDGRAHSYDSYLIAMQHSPFIKEMLPDVNCEFYAAGIITDDNNYIRRHFLRSSVLAELSEFLGRNGLDENTALNVALNVPIKRKTTDGYQFLTDSHEKCIAENWDLQLIGEQVKTAIKNLLIENRL